MSKAALIDFQGQQNVLKRKQVGMTNLLEKI